MTLFRQMLLDSFSLSHFSNPISSTYANQHVLNNKHQYKFSTIQLISVPKIKSTHPINAPGPEGKSSLLLGCLYSQ
jgi:hypothetical protein